MKRCLLKLQYLPGKYDKYILKIYPPCSLHTMKCLTLRPTSTFQSMSSTFSLSPCHRDVKIQRHSGLNSFLKNLTGRLPYKLTKTKSDFRLESVKGNYKIYRSCSNQHNGCGVLYSFSKVC